MVPVSADITYRGVQMQGRKLGVTEYLIRGEPSPRLAFWGGEQKVSAEGKLGRNGHSRFATSVSRYGGRLSLLGDVNASRELAMSCDIFDAGEGRASKQGVYSTYAAPHAQTYSLSLARRGAEFTQEFQMDYSQVRGGSEHGEVLGGTFGMGRPFGRHFHGNLNGTLLSESTPAGKTTRYVINASVAYKPASWMKLEVGMSLAPQGLAIAGTPLTGVTSFLLYQPGGATDVLQKHMVGYGMARLVIAHAL
jgi:hypothetical protein